ncbi:uracil phosphoribosyltransferase [Fulvivirga lutea]|uniref:Uracil phosphoribosyltransferase n=1 Tax=Fulvivirga lutea TaxID=2810512 RepID=A0A974WJZ7_9BACT|nr:uracil phosphoribosyltransferase [Fulvivirga lutea]QSE97550.1 uracil phosphoribosyltransferase [Fulvivirga lutea]
MVVVINEKASIANHFLYELRHKGIQKDRAKFRLNLKKLGQIMGYEVSKSLKYSTQQVETPLATANVELLSEQPVLVTILRASIPFFNGFLDYFEQSDVAFIGEYRQEGTSEVSVKLDYVAAPKIKGRPLIIIDPMLATGKSLIKAFNQLSVNGLPSSVHFVSAVAAPEGINYIADHLSIDYTIWTASLDEKLNEHSFIVPGLGDAGDLSFGEKL